MKFLRRFKRKSLFQKSLIIFTILIGIVGISFLGYVWSSMVIYERNLADNYIKYLAETGKITAGINDDLFAVSKYEKKDAKISDGLKKVFKSDDLVVKKNTKLSKDNIYAYDLKLNDKLISTVSLKSKNSYTRMAILKIDEWEVIDTSTYFENGIYSYEISIPIDYKLYINDVLVNEVTNTLDVDGLERLTKHVEIAKNNVYLIDNLVYEPKIKVLDKNGKIIDYKENNGKIVISKEFKKIKNEKDAMEYIKEDFDILELARNWSLFLTDDLQGSYHGFFKLTPFLIEDTYMYEMAYGWSHNVDITFVSSHRLKNPTFTGERIENFIIYNENAFSCEVYLEKNMVVSGKDKLDIMHDRLYFVYVDGGYKLVNMESI